MRNLLLEVSDQGTRYTTTLVVDASARAEAEYDGSILTSPRITQVLRDLELGNTRLDDLKDIGTHLWDALFQGDVEALFERTRAAAEAENGELSIRLSLPRDVELLPWEALYDERRLGFVVIHPSCSIGRVVPNLHAPRVADRPPGPLSILVVIPEGSGLNVDHEWNNLRLAVGKIGDEAVHLERLDGRVTAVRLGEVLRSRSWDVLHYVGHGAADERGNVRIRMNGEGSSDIEYMMEAEPFSSLFLARPPRLVLLNCCLGGLPDPSRTLGGLAPYLRRDGVPAVIAMRYEIQDEVAIKLSETFYRELLTGTSRGRVDVALRQARHAVHLSQRETTVRGFVTPILHLAEGLEKLFDIPDGNKLVPGPQPTAGDAAAIPMELLHAVRDHQCIIVLGPVPSSAVRSADGNQPEPPAGPRELAFKLASESEFPLMAEFELAANPDRWISSFLLPAVCQHYQRKNKLRIKLVQAIQRIYRESQPPEPLLSIAAWDAPGIFCTHFDGLMEDAFKIVRRPPRVVLSVEQPIDIAQGDLLLIQLRGAIRDERSLILTEEDNDRLMDVLGRLPSQLVAMAKGPGRSVLFLGVSPRDPLIRRLGKQLLDTGDARLQGPTFFACTDHTVVDEAYWGKYDVTWISLPPDEVVAGLTTALSRHQ